MVQLYALLLNGILLKMISTTAAELTELNLAACEVEAMRNLNDETGLKQDGPTVIYQDNQAAIQIAMNRGSVSRRTRATETAP
jgi:hypothetical protein